MREHSVSPEALSERAKHASLAAGETIGGASARGKNSTGSAFLYASPGTSDSSRYSSLNFYWIALQSLPGPLDTAEEGLVLAPPGPSPGTALVPDPFELPEVLELSADSSGPK